MKPDCVIVGDALTALRTLPDGSARCCVTSPPYWGLRDYGTATWEGGDAGCDHRQQLGGEGSSSAKQNTSAGTQTVLYRDTCGKCGARRIDAQMGLEKTPEEYVAGMVAVFREVRRVLADDGTLWLNIGDSYASQGGHTGQGATSQRAGRSNISAMNHSSGCMAPGLKPKDLVGIPWRLAFALQADGWYLRSDIIWAKPNPMPESVTDRPTKAHEYVFLLSKSRTYFYDLEAVREPVSPNWKRGKGAPMPERGEHVRASGSRGHQAKRVYDEPKGANARTVWSMATKPFRGAHFATMPPDLARRCIKAGSAEGDTVLDPFAGAGTVWLVALGEGRRAVNIELNGEYADIMVKRVQEHASLAFNARNAGKRIRRSIRGA